jgi:hypothetical protein
MDQRYEEAVLTYRRHLTQRKIVQSFPEDTLITFRNTIQAYDAAGRTVRTGKNGKDLRTSVTIRLIKKDVNVDAVDSEQGRKAAVDSLLIPIDIQIDDVVTRNVMVYSVTIKHNRTTVQCTSTVSRKARPQSTTLCAIVNRTVPC